MFVFFLKLINFFYLFIFLFLLLFYIVVKYLLFDDLIVEDLKLKYINSIWFKNNNKCLCLGICDNIIFDFYLNDLCVPPVFFKKLFLFVKSNVFFNSLISDINNSIKNVYIIIYIWETGVLSNKLALSIIKASKRGVKCKIIIDSIGSINFFKSKWPNLMRKNNVKIIEYLKINVVNILFKRVDLRQHKKLVIIDNYIVYTGSMNLIEKDSFKKYSMKKEWIDWMFKIKSIGLAKLMKFIFFYDWEIELGNINIMGEIKNNYNIYLHYFNCYKFYKNKQNYIQIVNSSIGLPNNLIYEYIKNILNFAKKRIVIITPYFAPNESIIINLCLISLKGIKVIIVLPKVNDIYLFYWINGYFFSLLLNFGVKIYLFKGNFLHIKGILVDDDLSLIGTVNFDIRSFWINLEIALMVKSVYLNNKLNSIINKYISNSVLVNWKIINNKSWWNIVVEEIVIKFYYLL